MTTTADAPSQDFSSISDLAREFDLTPRAIRFYESRGLIEPLRRGTHRLYSRRDRARLSLIVRGRNLGFTLEDVAKYLELYDADPSQQAQTQLLLEKVEAAIRDLETKKRDTERALKELAEIRQQCRDHLQRASRQKPQSRAAQSE